MRSAAVNILDLAKRNVDAIRLKNLDPLDYRERERESRRTASRRFNRHKSNEMLTRKVQNNNVPEL